MADPGEPLDYDAMIRRVALEDGRYPPEAFELVSEALQRTTELLAQGKLANPALQPADRVVDGGKGRFHVHGRELLEGFRIHVREQFGDLALFMLRRFGLHRSEDVGQVVFLMVNAGLMGKRDSDSLEDFAEGFDFAEAFGPSEGAG
ncbi:MAG: Minf_1886 family protein [Planctomycetota bacterium]